jgi:DnaJ-class molecular chaperone
VGVKQHYIDLNVRALCIKCSGTRSEMGYTWQVCVYCEGTGIETEKVGHVLTRKTCSYCDGSKQFIKYKCIECEGTGQTVLVAPYE